MLFNEVEKVGEGEDGLKRYLGGVQKTMYWQTWRPFVEQAEIFHIIPAIGQDLYDELTKDGLSADEKKLKHRMKMALAWLAYVDAMPSLASSTGDNGIVVAGGESKTTAAMSKWLYLDTMKRHTERADNNLEGALEWLEENADKFPDWKASKFYTIQRDQLLNSASQASRYFPALRNSRRVFLTIRAYYNLAANDHIRPLLGATAYKALLAKEAQTPDLLTENEEEVLTLSRRAVVQLAMVAAVPYLNMNNQFRLVYDIDGGAVGEAPVNADRLNIVRNDAMDNGNKHLADLRNYLNAHASETVFPDYFRSSRYVAPAGSSPVAVKRIANDSANKYFIL